PHRSHVVPPPRPVQPESPRNKKSAGVHLHHAHTSRGPRNHATLQSQPALAIALGCLGCTELLPQGLIHMPPGTRCLTRRQTILDTVLAVLALHHTRSPSCSSHRLIAAVPDNISCAEDYQGDDEGRAQPALAPPHDHPG